MPTESDVQRAIRAKRHSRSPDHAIGQLATIQHGVVSLDQLEAVGLSRSEVSRRTAKRRFVSVHRAVFAVGYRPLTRTGWYWAALLAVGDDAVLSHSSAAELWGLLPMAGDDIHVTVAEVQRRCHDAVRAHRHRLDDSEVVVNAGIRVTSPVRTLVDLASIDPRRVERAIRQAEYLGLVTASEVGRAVDELAGRRGVRALRRALGAVADAPGVLRSGLERRFLTYVRRRGLPVPELNAEFWIGDLKIEADCVWREAHLMVELDGRAAHQTTAAFESDRARDAALQAAGWRVVRITGRRLEEDGDTLHEQLQTLLTRRE